MNVADLGTAVLVTVNIGLHCVLFNRELIWETADTLVSKAVLINSESEAQRLIAGPQQRYESLFFAGPRRSTVAGTNLDVSGSKDLYPLLANTYGTSLAPSPPPPPPPQQQ